MSGSQCGAHCTSLASSHWSYKGGSIWKMLCLSWQRRQVLLEVEWKDYMEKEEKHMVEVASQLSSANWQQRTPSYVYREHWETLHVLPFLTDAIPWWFPNLGSVEVMRAHHVGAPEEDTNGRPVARTITDRDPESGAWPGREAGGKGHLLHPCRNLT